VDHTLEITRLVDIVDKSRLRRLPAQQLARLLARCGRIHAGEHGEPGVAVRGFLGRLAVHRQLKTPADHPGDIPERHAFFRDRLIPRSAKHFCTRRHERRRARIRSHQTKHLMACAYHFLDY
jgi:hypothetical protein